MKRQTDAESMVPRKEFRDRVQVFLYNNLSQMISPHPEVLLTPSIRAGLIDDINYLPGGYGFPPDLQEILNAFVLTNINQISTSPPTGITVITSQTSTER